MRDDEAIDGLLRQAMTARTPELSPDFEARLLRRLRGPRLTTAGKAAMAAYATAASATAFWALRGLSAEWIATAVVGSLLVAAASSAYGRRFAQSVSRTP